MSQYDTGPLEGRARRATSSQTKCGEVELVREVHTLFVRSAPQVVQELQVREEVEGMRQEVREVKEESKVEERDAHFMDMWMTWMTNTRLMTYATVSVREV